MQYTDGLPQGGEPRANPLKRWLLMAAFSLLLLPVFAMAQPTRSTTPGSPQLESLQIEIWPEYDRPAALVIMRGALPADAVLPANLALRIPAASGGPSAVAYSAAAGGNLLNLEYERSEAKDYITLRLKLPERYFHIEFYDPIAVGAPERSYSYVWPGDIAVKQMRVIVQEPAAASNFSVQPRLENSASGQEGLRYRSGELGAQGAGKQLPIKVSYSKTDSRTSVDMLQPKTPATAPGSSASSGVSSGGSDDLTGGLLVFVLVVSLFIGVGSAVLWWRDRSRAAAPATGGARHCVKCGARRAPSDLYCSKCGARLK